MGLYYNVKSTFLKFLGDSHLDKYPPFYTYRPAHHKVRGYEVREILDNLKPGDPLLRRMDGYLTTLLMPGFWSHTGLYLGDGKVAHAVKEGIIIEGILDFCRTDSIAVVRVKGVNEVQVKEAIDKARSIHQKGAKYDYDFKPGNDSYYCTEFVNVCYDGKFNTDYTTKTYLFKKTTALIPDGFYVSKSLDIIKEFKH